jgi:thymidylate synthase
MKEYDQALHRIMNEGWDQGERTGNGCRTFFGLTTRYDISERVPVLTYRKIVWKSFVKEVLWYISGSANIHDLEAMGCGVWTPWIDDDFTKKAGLEQGSIGYGYGHNLIHFGSEIDEPLVAAHNGFNQLDYVIDTLRNNPTSRQAMFIMWRPDKLNEVRLPACHFAYQLMVSPDEDGEMKNLTCQVFQRSNDYPIGVGAGNLFIGAIFTYLIAQQCGLKPKELIHSGSHCHVYQNAFHSTNEYLNRAMGLPARSSPKLVINKKESIYDYTIDDFELIDYNPYPKIHFPIAV